MASNQLSLMRDRHERISRAVAEALQPTLNSAASDIADLMKRFAPVAKDAAHGLPPGSLRDSIEVTPGGATTPAHSEPGGSRMVPDDAVLITAGNEDVRYAHFPEYGTIKMAAEPYFWPAVRLLREQTKTKIRAAFLRAVKNEWESK